MRYRWLQIAALSFVVALVVAFGGRAMCASSAVTGSTVVAEASDDSSSGDEDTEFC